MAMLNNQMVLIMIIYLHLSGLESHGDFNQLMTPRLHPQGRLSTYPMITYYNITVIILYQYHTWLVVDLPL